MPPTPPIDDSTTSSTTIPLKPIHVDNLAHTGLVTAFKDTKDTSWPKYNVSNYLVVDTLSKVLAGQYESDAHFSPYSSPQRKGRFGKRGRDDGPGAHELLEHGILTIAFVGDVDCAEVHRTSEPAPSEWRAAEKKKLDEVRERHPGIYAYDTRGGYRVILLLPQPVQIRLSNNSHLSRVMLTTFDYPHMVSAWG